MDINTSSFETWFDTLVDLLKEEHNINFLDADSVRFDYEDGKDVLDVVEEIRAEYED